MIHFRPDPAPHVTIVMVTFGHWDMVRRALTALEANTDPAYEVVIVDNASPHAMASRIEECVSGARLVRNQTNFGFGMASNQGALLARSQTLCFLNSDAFVQAGWLPPLLSYLSRDPNCGGVVPRKLNEDGSLQEACSLVAGDGGIFMYGLDADPDAPAYAFRRSVDFGGAACLLVRRSAFDAVGGFHPRYGLGYYEDVDLCFSLRRKGWRVVYEPRSTILHVGGGSSTYEEAVRLSERNRVVFRARWATRLRSRPSSWHCRLDSELTSLRDHDCRPRALVLDDGQSTMAADVAFGLVQRWPDSRVTLATCSDGARDPALARAGVEVVDRREPGALDGRRHQYSVIVASALLESAEWRLLEEQQPQARFALISAGGPLTAPPATLPRHPDVIVVGAGPVRYTPGVPTVALGRPIDPGALEEAFSHVGFAPRWPVAR